ncbi:unnamed protein product [Gongylonema pulchrum]|uniref:Clumping factor B n=1 Tax=Gongylonema pulchrum TaxID=637853 RepID=A0A183DD64_9BILA|nr:unnamed protein product [Gongylonema pulchrum]
MAENEADSDISEVPSVASTVELHSSEDSSESSSSNDESNSELSAGKSARDSAEPQPVLGDVELAFAEQTEQLPSCEETDADENDDIEILDSSLELIDEACSDSGEDAVPVYDSADLSAQTDERKAE